jgi:hypothetical protein
MMIEEEARYVFNRGSRSVRPASFADFQTLG